MLLSPFYLPLLGDSNRYLLRLFCNYSSISSGLMTLRNVMFQSNRLRKINKVSKLTTIIYIWLYFKNKKGNNHLLKIYNISYITIKFIYRIQQLISNKQIICLFFLFFSVCFVWVCVLILMLCMFYVIAA